MPFGSVEASHVTNVPRLRQAPERLGVAGDGDGLRETLGVDEKTPSARAPHRWMCNTASHMLRQKAGRQAP
jgi:hypothetical protein